MSARVLWTPQAQRDLATIAIYVASGITATALRFLDAMEAAAQLLSEHPLARAAALMDDAPNHEFRRWGVPGFRHYLMFYVTSGDEVEIVRILHGARDRTHNLLTESVDE